MPDPSIVDPEVKPSIEGESQLEFPEEDLGAEEEISQEVEPEIPTKEQIAQAVYEDMARPWGWKPKDEFDGPPERWVDARLYVERDKQLSTKAAKSARVREDGLHKRVASLQEGQVQTQRRLDQLIEQQRDSQRTQIEAQIASLSAQRQEAIQLNEDAGQVAKLSDQIAELKSQQKGIASADESAETPRDVPTAQQADTSEEDEAWQTWKADNNSWFEKDPDLTRKAMAYLKSLSNQWTTDPATGRPVRIFSVQEMLDSADIHIKPFVDAKASTVVETNKPKEPEKKPKEPGKVVDKPTESPPVPATVRGKSPKTRARTMPSEADLKPEQVLAAKSAVRSGTFATIDEWIKQADELGVLT